MVEIFSAYMKGCSVYKIVTPYKTITKVMNCDCDETMLAALKATRAKNITLITKSNMYELIYKGAEPRDQVQKNIYSILLDKNVVFERIDEYSQKELVDIMKSELARKKAEKDSKNKDKDKDEDEPKDETVIVVDNSEPTTKLDEVVFDLEFDDDDENEDNVSTDVGEKVDKDESDGGYDPFS